MKSKNESIQSLALKEGNQKLGVAFGIQIQRQDNLFQLQKNNYALMEECDKRNRKFRQIEDEIDTRDKIIKQAISDFRTQVGLRLLDIQNGNQKYTQVLNELNKELAKIILNIKRNNRWIFDQKASIQTLQNAEVSAIQYYESLTRQNNSLKSDIQMRYDSRLRSEITWFSNEICFLNNRISHSIANQEDARSIHIQYDEEMNNLRQRYKAKKKMIRSITSDDFELMKQKIIHFQNKVIKLNDIMRDMHEMQKTLVSRISTLTVQCIQKEFLIEKCTRMISHSSIDSTHSLLNEDYDLIYRQIKNKYQSKITLMDKSILEQKNALYNQIQAILDAKRNHQNHIQNMKQEILEYPHKEKDLKNELSECEEISRQLDQQYSKINSSINQLQLLIPKGTQTSLISDTGMKLMPQVPLSFRDFEFDFQQMKAESEIEAKIDKIKEDINYLNNTIYQFKIDNKQLRKNFKKNVEMRKSYLRSNCLCMTSTEIQNVDSLKTKIALLEKKINNRILRNTKAKRRIKYKFGIINNVEDCMKGNQFASSFRYDKSGQNKINIWMLRIEREILKWASIQHPDSITCVLKQWNNILENEIDL